MQSSEFCRMGLPYLAQLFPEMEKRVTTEEQVERWWVRFGHLDFATWKRAVDAYADDNHFPPTVNKLMEHVPESQRTKAGKSDYTRPGAYKEFESVEPPATDEEFVPDWAELYRQLNTRDWGMD